MSKEAPDHEDAALVFRAYELRREPVMRESRNAINGFWPRSYEEWKEITKTGHPLNAPYRQVATYWEMVYGIVKHRIVNSDYFMESNGEGLLLFAKVAPHLDRIRAEISPIAFRNAEWVAKETREGQRLFAIFEGRVKAMEEARNP